MVPEVGHDQLLLSHFTLAVDYNVVRVCFCDIAYRLRNRIDFVFFFPVISLEYVVYGMSDLPVAAVSTALPLPSNYRTAPISVPLCLVGWAQLCLFFSYSSFFHFTSYFFPPKLYVVCDILTSF